MRMEGLDQIEACVRRGFKEMLRLSSGGSGRLPVHACMTGLPGWAGHESGL